MRWFCRSTVAMVWLAAAGLHAQSVASGPPGVITGKVRGEEGGAIAGSYVSVLLLSPPAKGDPQTEWTVVTDKSGDFRFEGLGAGRYRICVHVPNSEWLNPCQWGLKYPQVALSRAQPVVDASVVLKKGAVIGVRVQDPGRRLSQYEGKTRGAHFLVGVRNDAFAFMTARETGRDAISKNLRVVIPFDSARTLVVRSPFFQLADGAGVALAPKRATLIPLLVPAGQKPADVVVTVTGGGIQ